MHDALWLRNRTCKSWCDDTNSDYAMIIQNRFNACLKSNFLDVETRNMHDLEQDKIGHKESLGGSQKKA